MFHSYLSCFPVFRSDESTCSRLRRCLLVPVGCCWCSFFSIFVVWTLVLLFLGSPFGTRLPCAFVPNAPTVQPFSLFFFGLSKWMKRPWKFNFGFKSSLFRSWRALLTLWFSSLLGELQQQIETGEISITRSETNDEADANFTSTSQTVASRRTRELSHCPPKTCRCFRHKWCAHKVS